MIIPDGNPGPGAAASSHPVPRGITASAAAARMMPVVNPPGAASQTHPVPRRIKEGLHKNAIAQARPEWSSVRKFAVAFFWEINASQNSSFHPERSHSAL